MLSDLQEIIDTATLSHAGHKQWYWKDVNIETLSFFTEKADKTLLQLLYTWVMEFLKMMLGF